MLMSFVQVVIISTPIREFDGSMNILKCMNCNIMFVKNILVMSLIREFHKKNEN